MNCICRTQFKKIKKAESNTYLKLNREELYTQNAYFQIQNINNCLINSLKNELLLKKRDIWILYHEAFTIKTKLYIPNYIIFRIYFSINTF